MPSQRIRIALAAAITVALPSVASAQFPPPPGSSAPPPVQERWPDPPKQPSAAAPSPAQPAAPKRHPAEAKAAPGGEEALHAPTHKPAPRPPAHAVACNGVFAKDSTHLKLAMRFNSRNVVYGQVDGSDGSKIPASILYPNDPKLRLEVLWKNDDSRSDTSVISINGKSQWTAPKGLRLGLPIATLEKLNGKPFKLSGFAKDGSASVLDWEGGALNVLPGDCKVGMRLFEDTKAAQQARDAVADQKELESNDAKVRAVKPSVGEILIGY